MVIYLNLSNFLIRKERLHKNWSQEGLCKGICTVSYLSKIEQGKVTPSSEIIILLFQKLGIQWNEKKDKQDQNFIELLYEFIFSYHKDEAIHELQKNDWKSFEYSNWGIDYLLIEALLQDGKPLYEALEACMDKRQLAIQREIKPPKLDSENKSYGSKYIKLETMIDVVRPVLTKHGLSFIQNLVCDGNGRVGCSTILIHETGEFIAGSHFVLPIFRNDAQAAGCATTYARRYSLSAMLGLSGEVDDDGNAASDTSKGEKKFVQEISSQVNQVIKEKNIPATEVSKMVHKFNCKKFEDLNAKQAKYILKAMELRQ